MLDTQTYARQYMEFMELVEKNNHVCNISTITLIGDLDTAELDLARLVESLSNSIFEIKISSKNQHTVTKRGKIKKSFFNQITLNYKDISKKSIKLFSNGIIHITGLTCFLECNKLSLKIVDIINECLNTNISLLGLRIGMINNNFSCNYNLNLRVLSKKLITTCYISRYNPESYPAINLKYEKVSIFIFGSGNVVITGGKSLEEIIDTYKFITNFIRNNPEVCKGVNVKTKKPSEYVHGYPIRQMISCMTE